jgi:hypothetical protein
VDPRREAERLTATLREEGYLVFLGLGGGFYAAAALEREETCHVLVIDYNLNGMAELLSSLEYIPLFKDPRFHLLVDPTPSTIEEYLLNTYKPVLHGGIRVFPLRARTEYDQDRFNAAGDALKSSIDSVSRDYSVQAYFGKRWFSNIIRNLPMAEVPERPLAPVRRVLIAAAGPSLDLQLPRIREERTRNFLIAADTALSALLNGGIEPDAVISIDCQHISYQHFFSGFPEKTLLFLDLASPPALAGRSKNPRFFSSCHPLSQYIRRQWRSLPFLDTSGANVTYAALSLAESLGAEQIRFYGADFSYPGGKTYARGTYLYPYFEKQQSRFKGLEALHSAFLYRSPSLRRCQNQDTPWYYETQSLKFYRERLEEKAARSKALLLNERGEGPGIDFPEARDGAAEGPGDSRFGGPERELSLFAPGRPRGSAREFLRAYREELGALHSFSRESPAALTLLPVAAAVRREYPGSDIQGIFTGSRNWCLGALDRVLARI